MGLRPQSPPPDYPQTKQYKNPVTIQRRFSNYNDSTTLPTTIEATDLETTQPHINNPDGIPRIWAYIGTDDPTRGDSRRSTGLAKQIAALLNGQMLYVDQAMLDKCFPYTSSYEKKLRKLLQQQGAPDIILGTRSNDITRATGRKVTMAVSCFNETISSRLDCNTLEKQLVSHDLTPEILKTAGEEFRKNHPEIKGELVGVLLSEIDAQPHFYLAEKLAQMVADLDNPTIFLCPSRRTPENEYRKFVGYLEQACQTSNATQKPKIIAPSFKDMRHGYNPYRGLLDQADYMVLAGESQSMMSEAIYNGRPLYMTLPVFKELGDAGYALDLSSTAVNTRFTKDRLPAISITETVAKNIADEFNLLARARSINQNQLSHQPKAQAHHSVSATAF